MFKTELFNLIKSINGDTFIIGDTHFNHENIYVKYEPIRLEQMKKDGFTDHNEWIIHNWNSVVGPEDLVIFMGDFAFKGIPDLKGRLNGKMIFILGNHDRKGPDVYKDLFDYTLNGAYLEFNNKIYHAKSTDELFSALMITYEDKGLLLSHYPATEQEKKYYSLDPEKVSESRLVKNHLMCNRIDEIMNLCDENDVTYNLHGHTHSNDVDDDSVMYKFINCSLEAIDFKPIRLKELIDRAENGGIK